MKRAKQQQPRLKTTRISFDYTIPHYYTMIMLRGSSVDEFLFKPN
jgi:hypothetical protein